MLKHYKDEKENNLHEIYSDDFNEIEMGWGETKEKAFEDYKNKVEKYYKKLKEFRDNLNKNEIEEVKKLEDFI